VLLRGLSGSGKTTLVKRAFPDFMPVSADDHFEKMVEGVLVYNFDASKLKEAHQMCRSKVSAYLHSGSAKVVVHNTFSTRWEMDPYLKMAEHCGVVVTVIDLFDGGLSDRELFRRNAHGVPLETIQQMRGRWEHDWKNGNPIPPWERVATTT
jgi:predicted kinase